MKKLFFAMLILAIIPLFLSCAYFQDPGTEPVKPILSGPCTGPSMYQDKTGAWLEMKKPMETTLCKLDPYWTESRVGFMIVNDIALRKKLYKPADVYAGTAKIRAAKDAPGATVGTVVLETVNLIGQYPELFIATRTLETYKQNDDLIIDPFTSFHIGKLLDDNDALAAMFEK